MSTLPHKSRRFKDLTDRKFNRLTALEYRFVNNKSYWLCRCECGTEVTIDQWALKNGRSKSCGCLKIEMITAGQTRHGYFGTSIYKSWAQMLNRCRNTSNAAYGDYGGRGITVCERWHKFENFLADMGVKPPGTHIDRIDNDKGYFKENCRWATRLENARNKRNTHYYTYNTETMTLGEWAEKIGVRYNFLYQRLFRGQTFQQALEGAKQWRTQHHE